MRDNPAHKILEQPKAAVCAMTRHNGADLILVFSCGGGWKAQLAGAAGNAARTPSHGNAGAGALARVVRFRVMARGGVRGAPQTCSRHSHSQNAARKCQPRLLAQNACPPRPPRD